MSNCKFPLSFFFYLFNQMCAMGGKADLLFMCGGSSKANRLSFCNLLTNATDNQHFSLSLQEVL